MRPAILQPDGQGLSTGGPSLMLGQLSSKAPVRTGTSAAGTRAHGCLSTLLSQFLVRVSEVLMTAMFSAGAEGSVLAKEPFLPVA